MTLFSGGFDRIVFFFYTNEDDKRIEEGQHSNVKVKKVALHAMVA